MEAGTSGVLSISDSGRRLPAEYGQESHAWSSVEEWISACLSSCSRSDRPLVELCLEPAGFSGRCTGVSVRLRVVPSSKGLPSKRCRGIGMFLNYFFCFPKKASKKGRVVEEMCEVWGQG